MRLARKEGRGGRAGLRVGSHRDGLAWAAMEMCDESWEAPRVTDAGVKRAELSDPVALVSRLHYVPCCRCVYDGSWRCLVLTKGMHLATASASISQRVSSHKHTVSKWRIDFVVQWSWAITYTLHTDRYYSNTTVIFTLTKLITGCLEMDTLNKKKVISLTCQWRFSNFGWDGILFQ